MGDALLELKNAKSTNEKFLARLVGDTDKVASDRSEQLSALEERANPSFLPNGVDNLPNTTLAVLQAEEDRLRGLMALDEDKAKRHKRLSDKISETVTKIANLDRTIQESESADGEIKAFRGKFASEGFP